MGIFLCQVVSHVEFLDLLPPLPSHSRDSPSVASGFPSAVLTAATPSSNHSTQTFPSPKTNFTNTPPTPPLLSKRQARNTARKLRKLQKAEELQEELQDLSDSAIPLVYTDGSSAVEDHAGHLAGYGIFCEKQVSIVAFVPDDYRQTNTSAELLAVIRALRILSTGDIAICTDSQYVILGGDRRGAPLGLVWVDRVVWPSLRHPPSGTTPGSTR